MTVNFKRKSDGEVVAAMLHDGTQETAVGLSVWAGSQGATVNIKYRGGDADDWVVTVPLEEGDAESIAIGDWLVQSEEAGFFAGSRETMENDYERLTNGE